MTKKFGRPSGRYFIPATRGTANTRPPGHLNITITDEGVFENDNPCSCGSGKRYERCCDPRRLFVALSQQKRELTEQSLSQRNILLLDTLNELFGLEAIVDIGQLKHRVSSDAILKLYGRIATIFPFGTDLEYLLPEPDQSLRALFWGSSNPRNVLNNVARYSLYSDEIMLYSPFVNPWTAAPENNPLLRPEVFKQDTLSALVLIAVLAPWIRKGLVHLVPDPGDFDQGLRYRTTQLAEERIKNREIVVDDLYREEFEDYFSRFIFAAPDDFLYQKFKEFDPTTSETQLNQMVLMAKRMNREDPLALSQSTTEQIHMERGGNLEIAAFVAQATNAFPYTNLKSRWDEIRACIKQFPPESQPWSPLTESFQQLDFHFLDNVDPNFAYKLHEDGRLGSFRNFLRKIWRTQDTADGKVPIRDFCDELKSEYNKAKGELDKVNADTIKSGSKLFGSITAGAGSIVCGHMQLLIPSGWFAAQAIGELGAAKLSRRAFRHNVPMSVFVDLSKKRR